MLNKSFSPTEVSNSNINKVHKYFYDENPKKNKASETSTP